MKFLEALNASRHAPTDNVLVARPNGPILIIGTDGSINTRHMAEDQFYLGDILDFTDWAVVTLPNDLTPEIIQSAANGIPAHSEDCTCDAGGSAGCPEHDLDHDRITDGAVTFNHDRAQDGLDPLEDAGDEISGMDEG